MDVYAHEKEQIEEIKAWWRENRWYIVAGLAISVAIVGGWRWWQEYQQSQGQAASLRYETLVTKASLEDLDAVAKGTRELQADYSGTPYAALASLKLAAAHANAGEFEETLEPLRWAMENTDDDELALVARARLARALLQLERNDEALALLNGVDAGKFAAMFAELRGDAFLAQGDRDAARAAYEESLAAMEQGLGERRLVQMKLENVAMPIDQLMPKAPVAAEETASQGEEE